MSQLAVFMQAAAAGLIIGAGGALPPIILNHWTTRGERKRIEEKLARAPDFSYAEKVKDMPGRSGPRLFY